MKNFNLEEIAVCKNDTGEQHTEWAGDHCRRYQLDRRVTQLNVIERFFYRGGPPLSM